MKLVCRYLWLGLIASVLYGAAACTKDPAAAKARALSAGNAYFDQHRYADAIVEYRRALQVDPKFGQARYKLAQSYEQLGDGRNAAVEYIRAADELPDDPDAQVRAGTFFLIGDMFEDAKARAMKALDKNPRHVEAQLLLAQATARMKDINGAVSQIEESIRMDPDESRTHIGLGVLRLAQGNIEQAEEAFKRAISLDPKSMDAMLGLARFYLATGRLDNVEEWLKKAVALEPNDPMANRSLAAFYMSRNRFPEAEIPLKVYVQGAPSSATRLVLADYYFAAQRNDDARKVLEDLKKDPALFSEVRARLSVLDMNEGHRQEAQADLEEVLAKDPKDVQALLLKGRYLLSDRQFQGARDVFSTLVASAPNFSAGHYWLGVAHRNLGNADAARAEFTEAQRLAPAEPASKLQLAQLNLLDGKLEAAASLVNEALQIQPGSFLALATRVDVLAAQGQWAEGLKAATQLAVAFPTMPQPAMQLGRIYLKRADHAAAERSFQQAVQLSKGAVDAVGALVDVEIAAGKIAEARTLAEQQVAKDPKQPWFHLYAARAYNASHETAKATAALKDALAIDPANLEAYLELTRIYVAQQNFDEARAQLEAIVAKQPQAVWAHTLIAMSLHVQNRKAEARQRYEKILQIDPRAVIAANNLAMMLLDEGQDLDRALGLVQIAKEQLPESPIVNDTLGSVYTAKSLGNLAIPPLQLSTQKDPENPLYEYHLGLAYAQVGDIPKALALLRQALSRHQAFEGRDDARKTLDGLSARSGR